MGKHARRGVAVMDPKQPVTKRIYADDGSYRTVLIEAEMRIRDVIAGLLMKTNQERFLKYFGIFVKVHNKAWEVQHGESARALMDKDIEGIYLHQKCDLPNEPATTTAAIEQQRHQRHHQQESFRPQKPTEMSPKETYERESGPMYVLIKCLLRLRSIGSSMLWSNPLFMLHSGTIRFLILSQGKGEAKTTHMTKGG